MGKWPISFAGRMKLPREEQRRFHEAWVQGFPELGVAGELCVAKIAGPLIVMVKVLPDPIGTIYEPDLRINNLVRGDTALYCATISHTFRSPFVDGVSMNQRVKIWERQLPRVIEAVRSQSWVGLLNEVRWADLLPLLQEEPVQGFLRSAHRHLLQLGLHVACWTEDEEVIRQFLELLAEADPRELEDREGWLEWQVFDAFPTSSEEIRQKAPELRTLVDARRRELGLDACVPSGEVRP